MGSDSSCIVVNNALDIRHEGLTSKHSTSPSKGFGMYSDASSLPAGTGRSYTNLWGDKAKDTLRTLGLLDLWL